MDCCSSVQTISRPEPQRHQTRVLQLRLRGSIAAFEFEHFMVRQGSQRRLVVVPGVKRRTVLQGLAGAAIALGVGVGCRTEPSPLKGEASSKRQLKKIDIGFCSYLICAIPFEVSRKQGFFAEEGLEVNLIYLRGGAAPIEALVGGSVDYGAGSYDAVLQATAKGAKIQRFVSTSNTPHTTLVTSASIATEINQLSDLEGRTVGVGELGGSAQNLVTYMMKRAGANPARVEFTLLGPNIYDAVRLNQVDAAMVTEPATTLLLQAGSRALVNLSDPDVAKRYLGGRYEGMGVAVRTAQRQQRLDEMRRIVRALDKCVAFMRTASAATLVDAVPQELIAGGRRDVFEASIERDRKGLIPESLAILPDAAQRALEFLTFVGKIQPGQVNLKDTFDLSVVGGSSA